MKILFVYDSCVISERVDPSLFNIDDTVCLFPLTSRTHITTAIAGNIKRKGCGVEIIQTAKMINSATCDLRNEYLRFIAELPEKISYRGRNLREFFAIDTYATLWWFSLISEKNTYKSDTFNRLVQAHSIIEQIRHKKIEKIIFWCKTRKLEDVLLEYASGNSIRFNSLPARRIYSLKRHILKHQKIIYLRHVLYLLNLAMHLFLKIWRIKRGIGNLDRNLHLDDKAIMLITPYPNMDISLAQKAIFNNKFYPYVQETLEAKGQNIVWIIMYVENNSISFRESLKYAQQFIENGYSIIFLEEFNSAGAQIKALLTMLTNGLRYLKIEGYVRRTHTFGEYNFYPLFRDDWYSSFVGTAGYSGLLCYSMFRSLLNKIKTKRCLYLCEMHAWEKALIFARDAVSQRTSLFGYQSGTVSRMLLNYFNHPSEIALDAPYAIKGPDRIVCDGQLPYSYMKGSGWPDERLSVVEAVRYNYLKDCLETKWKKKKNIVLLAFSIGPEESSSILNMAWESLRDLKNVEVWLKPHPFLQIERVFELTGIPKGSMSFQVKNGPIGDLLSEAGIVIVGESSVALEALAHGCDVLLLDAPEWINMSPLLDVKSEMVNRVSSPEELREAVVNIFKRGYSTERYAAGAKKIIDEYFYLNQDSNIPYRFLKLLEVD